MNNIIDQVLASSNLLNTIILILSLIVARILVIGSLRRSKLPGETKRQWIVQAKNALVLIFLIGLFFVWGNELRTFAISIVAIAAAIVIGTKELILCVLGGILKAITQPFKLGDRIEISAPNYIRGDVINHNMLTTQLYEIGPGKSAHQYTGKSITIPNSVFLSSPILNESKSAEYGLHTFSIFRPVTIDVKAHRELLFKLASEACEPHLAQARDYLNEMSNLEGITAPTVEPRVFVSFQSAASIEFVIRIPVESLRTGKIEQSIIENYVNKMPKDAVVATT